MATLPDSGLLPLVCDSVVAVSVGGLCVRSKMQKPLDSYQEQDLLVLRERWGEALSRRREHLDTQIQALVARPNKNVTEEEREACLVDQWVRLTEERNAVLAPTEEFFTMILYNSDPKSRVFLRRCLNPLVIFLSLAFLS